VPLRSLISPLTQQFMSPWLRSNVDVDVDDVSLNHLPR
jgi:hypothetical protein